LSRCRRNNLINCQKVILQGGRCFCSSSVHCVENLGGKVLILQMVRWKQNWILECLSSWGCRREKVERDLLKSKSLVGVLNYGLVQTSKAWRTAKPVGFRITWCPFFARLAAIPFFRFSPCRSLSSRVQHYYQTSVSTNVCPDIHFALISRMKSCCDRRVPMPAARTMGTK
jgi:hypothetical protein